MFEKILLNEKANILQCLMLCKVFISHDVVVSDEGVHENMREWGNLKSSFVYFFSPLSFSTE